MQSIDHGPQTEGYYPCLKPDVFNPTDLNADDWMAASASMGMREIIITAHHEGVALIACPVRPLSRPAIQPIGKVPAR